MEAWCLAHPFLTFIVLLSGLGTIDVIAKAIGGKYSNRTKNEEEEE